MTGNLEALSQAAGPIWLDDLSREPPVSGSLAKLAADDHVVGVTANPSAFARAIADSDTHVVAHGPSVVSGGIPVREGAKVATGLGNTAVYVGQGPPERSRV